MELAIGRLTSQGSSQPRLQTPSIQDTEVILQSIPPTAALLGICADGKPLLFDLMDSRTGALLVCGDPHSGKTAFLQSATASLLAKDPSGDIQYTFITGRPEEWLLTAHVARMQDSLRGAYAAWEGDAQSAILALAQLTEWRLHGRARGPVQWLVVDALDHLFQMPAFVLESFAWLLKMGSEVGVRVAVSLPTRSARILDEWVNAFPTRVFSHISDKHLGQRLTGAVSIQTGQLHSGSQFAVCLQHHWTTFHLPLQTRTKGD
jgi:hypothetical protein